MKYLLILLLSVSLNSIAGGSTTGAVPTGIDIERGNGLMVYGSFGNALNCTESDKFFVDDAHPQYKEIYSAVLAAYMSGKKIVAYIKECRTNAWYVTPDRTFNTLTSTGSLYLR